MEAQTDPIEEVAVFRDQVRPNEWRVEAFTRDGACLVAIFARPDAQARARRHALAEFGFVAP